MYIQMEEKLYKRKPDDFLSDETLFPQKIKEKLKESTIKQYKIYWPHTENWYLVEEGGMIFRKTQWGKYKYSYIRKIKETQKGWLQLYLDKNKRPLRIKQWKRITK